MEENKRKRRRPQDDLPEDEHLRILLLDYRKKCDALSKITPYAKQLEERIEELEHENQHLVRILEEARIAVDAGNYGQLPKKLEAMKKAFDESKYAELKDKYEKMKKKYGILRAICKGEPIPPQ